MSILRYFNKHQGWHDGKRTPFGDGGPSWNPVSWVEPIIQGAGDALASIDPGPAIGEIGASVDQAVNQLPGGWLAPAAVTALIAAPELAPMVSEAIGGGIEAGVGQDAFFNALAAGANSQEAVQMGLAAQQAGVSLTPEMIAYANASPDPIGSINAITGLTPEEFSSYTQIIGGPTQAANLTAGEDLASLMKSHPNLSTKQLEDILAINYGADPTVAADAANLAKEGYDASTINQVLGYSYNPTELSGTGVESFAPDSAQGLSAKEVLSNVNRARQLANLLSGGGGTGIKAASIPTAQQWTQNAQQVALNQPAQQQFGGLYEMNKNPFTFQNPLANALKGKDTTGLDVSGTPGTSLNTSQQNQIYSSLLRS